jgi:hypothetical protein
MKFVIFFAILILTSVGYSALSHEMVPAYLKLKPAPVDKVYMTSFKMFNRRNDVDYYSVSVYDQNWNSVPFASFDRVFKIEHLRKKEITVYIKESDIPVATYVCTSSKLYPGKGAAVTSRICSKIKQ